VAMKAPTTATPASALLTLSMKPAPVPLDEDVGTAAEELAAAVGEEVAEEVKLLEELASEKVALTSAREDESDEATDEASSDPLLAAPAPLARTEEA